jgi:hypothetical protein
MAIMLYLNTRLGVTKYIEQLLMKMALVNSPTL